MKSKVDMDSWARKEHFEFFSKFEEPYHGVTVNIDCTTAYRKAKKDGHSFFLHYLYKSLAAAQSVEALRLRIEDGQVYCYDMIDASTTIIRENGTLGFVDIPYHAEFSAFLENASSLLLAARKSESLCLSEAKNVIRYSALPYLDFTAHYRARNYSLNDSCPQIYFGMMRASAGKRTMPVSIHVNHALVDGVPIGRFVESFQDLMTSMNK